VLRGATKYLLEGYVGIVMGTRREALLRLDALCDNTHLQAKISLRGGNVKQQLP
jgi:hypothetical protein